MSADFYWESDVEHRLTLRTASKREVDELVFRQVSSTGARRWEMPSVLPDEAGWQAHREMLDAHLPFRHFEIARLRPNGSVHHVTVSGDPLFDAAANFKGYRGIGSDITERKRIELDLLASQRRLGAVLDGVQSAVITITERGLVESFNQSAVRMFGYSPGEVVGNNIRMLMPEPYRSEHDGYLDNYLRTGIKKDHRPQAHGVRGSVDGSAFRSAGGVKLLNDEIIYRPVSATSVSQAGLGRTSYRRDCFRIPAGHADH
jgi:PAS domain S-box-containing protein